MDTTSSLQNLEALKKALENGIISSSIVNELERCIEMTKEDIVKLHHYKLYQGKDGRWYTRFPNPEGGSKQRVFRSRGEAVEAIVKLYEETMNNPTVKELYFEYELDRLKKNKITSSTWQRNKCAFCKFFGEFGEKRIKDISMEDVCAFIEGWGTTGISSANFKRLKGLIKEILKAARKNGLIDYGYDTVNDALDISAKDLSRSFKDSRKEVYSEEECTKLKDFLINSDMAHDLALALFLFTGLRNGEMSALRWTDYDGETLLINQMERLEYDLNGYKHFTIAEGTAKTISGRRVVPLTDGAKLILEKMKKINPSGEFIFQDETGRRINSENLRKRLGVVCKRLGITYKPPHKLRKTFVTILLDGGMSPTIVQDIAGHKSPQTTLQYYKISRLSPKKIASEYYSKMPELRIE